MSQTLVVLSRPGPLQLLQRGLGVVLMVWALNSAAQLLWTLFPAPEGHVLQGAIVNPASFGQAGGASREAIRIEDALGLGLFGNPGQAVEAEVVATSAPSSPRDGIEEGASETRLALKLTGIVASTEDGLGTAVIAAKNVEATYSVGDTLPVQGDVTLAKIMATQVVLDNSGTYELLKLFEESALGKLAAESRPAPEPVAQPAASATSAAVTEPPSAEASALAGDLRAKLYQNPQSLAEVVQVAAVRDDSGLRGYRVSPGKNAGEFKALGFRPGDVVTAVNGLPLSDPANTVRLYQMMREATEATFDIERDGGTTSLSVSLGTQP